MSYLLAAGAWTAARQLNTRASDSRASSSAPPNTSSFRGRDHARISTTLHP